MRFFDSKILHKYSQEESNNKSVIFILGSPRTGSTILYQIITNFFNISYINNFVNLCRENIQLGFSFSNIFYKNKPHNTTSSKYGSTNKLNAPSEAGPLINKWFSSDSILESVDKNAINFKDNINAIINRYKKPLVIKNLSIDTKIKLMLKLFPNAKFIIVRRNPIMVAQSIFFARKNNNKNINDWWSIKPNNYEELKNKNVYHQIIGQIYYLEKKIFEDLQNYDNNKVLVLNYENLTNISNNNKFETFSNFINTNLKNNNFTNTVKEINISNSLKMEENDIKNFSNIIDSYNWNFEHNFIEI